MAKQKRLRFPDDSRIKPPSKQLLKNGKLGKEKDFPYKYGEITHTLSIRVPVSLYKKLQARIKRNGTNMTREIVDVLRRVEPYL